MSSAITGCSVQTLRSHSPLQNWEEHLIMWRHGDRGWEWTSCGGAIPGSPGLLSSLGRCGAASIDPSVRPHTHFCCDLVYPTCHCASPWNQAGWKLTPPGMGFPSQPGQHWAPRPEAQEPALFLPLLHPCILWPPPDHTLLPVPCHGLCSACCPLRYSLHLLTGHLLYSI